MGIDIEISGFGHLQLKYLVTDLNGTLSMYGELHPEVHALLSQLKEKMEIFILTADTLNTGEQIASELGVNWYKLTKQKSQATEKAKFVDNLGSKHVVVMGNGRNDVLMFQAAALAIGIMGEEGISPQTLEKADLIVKSPLDALKLLINPLALKAGLRN
ncbi:HAD family hydrolase [Candidatus Lokiarchaeum ossiferum]|uniref:HAD family hydrolase n=1 Tax=Candidatus Lokiarchaeum ossiferum TaxID=2951803 RepID=UPI00352C4F5D